MTHCLCFGRGMVGHSQVIACLLVPLGVSWVSLCCAIFLLGALSYTTESHFK